MLNTHTVNNMKTKKNEATAMHTRYTARYPVMTEQSRSLLKETLVTGIAVGTVPIGFGGSVGSGILAL